MNWYVRAARLNRPPSSLSHLPRPSGPGWRRPSATPGQRTDGLTTDEREELRRLRRENKTLHEEQEILRNQSGTAPTVPPVRRETGDAAMLIGALEAVAVSFMVTSRAR